MSDTVHVFLYGGASRVGAEPIRDDVVQGTLFDVDGVGPALMLAGQSPVRGAVVRVPWNALSEMDVAARVDEGLFRRVGVKVGETPCWTWVAGPALAPRLARSRRVRGGDT